MIGHIITSFRPYSTTRGREGQDDIRRRYIMDTMIKLSPDAIAALEALGQLWRQMSPMEQGYVCGEVHGRLKAHKSQSEQKEGA